MLILILSCIAAYCIGSLSSAIIISRLMGLPDPRTEGSKNPGATNVLRLGGKTPAILTLLGDALKGFIPVAIALFIDRDPYFIGPVMLAAFLGHLYPLFFNFQGGKGVATAIGALFALCLPAAFLFIITWGIVFYYSRISSLSAIVASILAPFYVLLFMNKEYALFVFIMSGILLWRHRQNIQRLKKGTEPKMKLKE